MEMINDRDIPSYRLISYPFRLLLIASYGIRCLPCERIPGALTELAYWARAAFDYLAMGNYPYATGYILNEDEGEVTLPPWPLREACSYMSDPGLEVSSGKCRCLFGVRSDCKR